MIAAPPVRHNAPPGVIALHNPDGSVKLYYHIQKDMVLKQSQVNFYSDADRSYLKQFDTSEDPEYWGARSTTGNHWIHMYLDISANDRATAHFANANMERVKLQIQDWTKAADPPSSAIIASTPSVSCSGIKEKFKGIGGWISSYVPSFSGSTKTPKSTLSSGAPSFSAGAPSSTAPPLLTNNKNNNTTPTLPLKSNVPTESSTGGTIPIRPILARPEFWENTNAKAGGNKDGINSTAAASNNNATFTNSMSNSATKSSTAAGTIPACPTAFTNTKEVDNVGAPTPTSNSAPSFTAGALNNNPTLASGGDNNADLQRINTPAVGATSTSIALPKEDSGTFKMLCSTEDLLLAHASARGTLDYGTRLNTSIRNITTRISSKPNIRIILSTSNIADMSQKECAVAAYISDIFENKRVTENFMGVDMSIHSMMSFTASILSEHPNNITRIGRIISHFNNSRGKYSWGGVEPPLERSQYERRYLLLTEKYSAGDDPDENKEDEEVCKELIRLLHAVWKERATAKEIALCLILTSGRLRRVGATPAAGGIVAQYQRKYQGLSLDSLTKEKEKDEAHRRMLLLRTAPAKPSLPASLSNDNEASLPASVDDFDFGNGNDDDEMEIDDTPKRGGSNEAGVSEAGDSLAGASLPAGVSNDNEAIDSTTASRKRSSSGRAKSSSSTAAPNDAGVVDLTIDSPSKNLDEAIVLSSDEEDDDKEESSPSPKKPSPKKARTLPPRGGVQRTNAFRKWQNEDDESSDDEYDEEEGLYTETQVETALSLTANQHKNMILL